MSISIRSNRIGPEGQRVNEIELNHEAQEIVIHCRRDRRKSVIDPVSGKMGLVNRYVRRRIRDLPLFGYPCMVDIELAQVFISKNERRIEKSVFVDK